MSNDLVQKSDVLELMENIIDGIDGGYNCTDSGCNKLSDFYEALLDGVECLQPKNAIELPCKVGDTLYEVSYMSVKKRIIRRIFIGEDNQIFLMFGGTLGASAREIGNTLFVNQEDAKAALRKVSKNG